jgi:hypothetical protein
MKEGITKYGVPMALYTGKHTIFRSPKEKEDIFSDELVLF